MKMMSGNLGDDSPFLNRIQPEQAIKPRSIAGLAINLKLCRCFREINVDSKLLMSGHLPVMNDWMLCKAPQTEAFVEILADTRRDVQGIVF